METKLSKHLQAPYDPTNKTRELITAAEMDAKLGRTLRDQETIDMVKRMNETSTKFKWSYDIVQGKVRVSITPRV